MVVKRGGCNFILIFYVFRLNLKFCLEMVEHGGGKEIGFVVNDNVNGDKKKKL